LSTFFVTFVTRERCTLCAAAEPSVYEWAERLSATVERVLVDDDPELVRRYGDRVPVVLGPDGHVLVEGRFSPESLGAAMTKARALDR
jgi:hypothetical protein